MDEKEYMERAIPAMTDLTELVVHVTIRDAWILDGVLALAYRHPALTDVLKAWILDLSKQFRVPLLDLHPEVADLLEMGWNEENDVPVDYAHRDAQNKVINAMTRKYLRKTGRL